MKNLLPTRLFHAPTRPYADLSPRQIDAIGDFNAQLKAGDFLFESVPCLCGSDNFDLVASVDRYSFHQQTVLCRDCGLILSNPRLDTLSCEKFYQTDLYRMVYDDSDLATLSKAEHFESRVGMQVFDTVSKFRKIDERTRVLDLGAGGGWNLVPFIKAGAEVSGLDYSPALVEIGRRHGIAMQQGGLNDIAGMYDVIILNHVLEHFREPIAALRVINHSLREEGLIYIGVPDIRNFSMGQLQNAHNYYFTPRTLIHYCALSGLQPLLSGPESGIHMFAVFSKVRDCAAPSLDGHYEEMLAKFNFLLYRERIRSLLDDANLYRPLRKLYAYFRHR